MAEYNITVDDYRNGFAWYPTKDVTPGNAREFFHNITHEIHEVIEHVEITTMSLKQPKIVIEGFKKPDRKYVEFITQYEDTYGRCYTMNATQELLSLGVTKVKFITLMDS